MIITPPHQLQQPRLLTLARRLTLISTAIFIAYCSFAAKAQTSSVPVLYISTSDGAPVVDKENYLDASYYLTIPPGSDFLPVGNMEKPEKLQIRGRGNASWKVAKKPYKIKLSKKTGLLGMPAHKHFALLANYGAINEISMFSSMVGFKIASLTNQPWVPRYEPVELVLNGEFLGLYLLVESIKIDRNRLDIIPQPDNCENPDSISGGWLVEVDNYADEQQILVDEYDENMQLSKMRVTHHYPEVLSDLQREWLTDEFTKLNQTLAGMDSTRIEWTELIDPVAFARYFIVREMIHDTDGYNGSFYLHKPYGEGAKWICGPMWDIYAITEKKDWVINDHPTYSKTHMVPLIQHDIRFLQCLETEWALFKEKIPELMNYIATFNVYSAADAANGLRWDRHGDTDDKISYLKRCLQNNIRWIDDAITSELDCIKNLSTGCTYNISDRVITFSKVTDYVMVINVSGLVVATFNNVRQVSMADMPRNVYLVHAVMRNGEHIRLKFFNP